MLRTPKTALRDLIDLICSPRPRFSGQLCAVFFCAWYVALAGFSSAQVNSYPSPPNTGFTLDGTVVNSVTGEPIARALVRVYGVAQRSAFTDSEGHFQIDSLPAGSVDIGLQKPGYSNQQGTNRTIVGVDSRAVVLKLSPLGTIYGHVLDTTGQPIENVPIRLIGRSISEGRTRWNLAGSAESDEDGRFRFSGLTPGSYYLAAGPEIHPETRLLARAEKLKIGYSNLYYPNAPDLSSASPIQLVAGQQVEADFSMPAVPVYKVSGSVTNRVPGRGVVLQVLSQSGDPISIATGAQMDGTFEIKAIPAGTYILKAFSHVENQTLRAEIHLGVPANLDNVNLVLAPTPLIPITVRMESRGASNLSSPRWSQQTPPLSLRLIPAAMLATEAGSTFVQQGSGQQIMALQNVEPGRYTADVMPWGAWYVQSAQYGPTNLLSDDVMIASGQIYPIEIVLRDDGATLTGSLKYNGVDDTPMTLIVVPQPTGKRGVKVLHTSQQGFAMNGLAPGDYLVFAFDHADKIEYTNPDALQPYTSQATPVTLSPNQETHAMLTLIHAREGE